MSQTEASPPWLIMVSERHIPGDMLHIVSPNNFGFTISYPEQFINLLVACTQRGVQIRVNESVRLSVDIEGVIRIIDFDTWENPDFRIDDLVGHVDDLGLALGDFLRINLPRLMNEVSNARRA